MSHALAAAVAPAAMELRGVSKRFGGVLALDKVDFELRAGEVHGLIGQNGAGKSTMLKLLSGAYDDYDGDILVAGRPVHFASPAAAQACGVGMVYQELSAFSHLSVAENIFGRRPPTRFGLVDWARMNREAQQHLHELGLDIDVRDVMGGLSVGHQQLIEIARVIFSGASIILLDEPTSALSPPETRRLFDFVGTLKAQGKTLVFISHFLEDVLQVTGRISVLRNGRQVAVLRTEETRKDELVSLLVGRESPALVSSLGAAKRAQPARPATEPALVVKGLTRRGAFSDISFSVAPGEIVGLFACMGAGHNQLGRCLFGAEPIDAGIITLGGKPLRLRNTTQAKQAGIAFVPEDRRHSLMLQQEVHKNITLAHLARLVPRWLDRKAELRIARDLIDRLGVRPNDPNLAVGALSGGNQQKVVLAKWLTQPPRLLVLNEPTRGMDVGAKDEVTAIVARLRDDGVAILLITAEPETLLASADRALVMRKGQLTAELRGAELTKENLLKHA